MSPETVYVAICVDSLTNKHFKTAQTSAYFVAIAPTVRGPSTYVIGTSLGLGGPAKLVGTVFIMVGVLTAPPPPSTILQQNIIPYVFQGSRKKRKNTYDTRKRITYRSLFNLIKVEPNIHWASSSFSAFQKLFFHTAISGRSSLMAVILG